MALVPDAEWRAHVDATLDRLERALQLDAEVRERLRQDVHRLDVTAEETEAVLSVLRGAARGAS